MGFASKLGVAIGIAGAAVLMYAQRRSERTGRDVGTVLSDLPGELRETRAELEKQLRKALEMGKKAAGEKEAEIERQLSADEPASSEVREFNI
jgi:hypothetical protein